MKSKQKKSRGRLYFIVLGIVSIVWLLIRVVPKPSRITYPCQRMAATNAVAFITWLLGTIFAVTLFKKGIARLKASRIPIAVLWIFLAMATGVTTIMLTSHKEIMAAVSPGEEIPYDPTDLNEPMGTAQGIFPGRVVWAHDPSAVTYNPASANGFWWDDNNTDPEKVDRMFELSLQGVTGSETASDSWDKLFRYANIRKELGDVGYTQGEKISIKINMLMGAGGGKEKANRSGPTPQMLHAIVEDLIVEVGVPGEDITVYDVSARMPDYIMAPFKTHINPEFQKIRFVGNPGYITEDRYLPATEDLDVKIHFADTTVTDIYLVKQVTESDYMINMTNLKGHTLSGVTMVAKNLYGSMYIPTATHKYTFGFGPNNTDEHTGLHKCIAVHEFSGGVGDFPAREMGTYNYLVDVLGHPEFYNRTMLYVIDAMYGGENQNTIVKFASFGDQYCSSLFLSQDPIALESVGLDFLRNEPNCDKFVFGYVDNSLHESAQADDPPSGMEYNPGNRAMGLESLGVHEHWNNSTDKQYTRNQGAGEGIELYKVDLTVGIEDYHIISSENAVLGPNFPNPFQNVTTIPFQLSSGSEMTMVIFDQLGLPVETMAANYYPSGSHTFQWDASDLADGIYFCQLRSGNGKTEVIELLKR